MMFSPIRCTLAAMAFIAIIGVTVSRAGGASMERLSVQSSDFSSGGTIPAKFTGDGQDINPNLVWSKVPAACKSIAITCTDPDAPRGIWWHWIIYNLRPGMTQLPENLGKQGSLAMGASQGTNDFGKTGYNGPAPPPGALHHYHFAVYGLDTVLNCRPGCTKAEFSNAINGHVLAGGEYVGTYKR